MVADSVAEELVGWLAEMPSGVDGDTEAARQRIGRTARLVEQVLSRVADRNELTAGDLAALSALQRSGPPYERTPRQLAATLGLASGTVSVRIDRLTQAGLVEPAAATDRRSRPVRLTPAGRRRWSDATGQRVTYERQLFGRALTADQLADLNALLGRLLATLEAEFGPASRHDVPRETA